MRSLVWYKILGRKERERRWTSRARLRVVNKLGTDVRYIGIGDARCEAEEKVIKHESREVYQEENPFSQSCPKLGVIATSLL
jgi:hypothetical protein